jgi:hypothetical protein
MNGEIIKLINLPFRAVEKAGNIVPIINNTAGELPMVSLVRKNTGTPTNAAAPKHTAWRVVKPKIAFDFMRVKSLGI